MRKMWPELWSYRPNLVLLVEKAIVKEEKALRGRCEQSWEIPKQLVWMIKKLRQPYQLRQLVIQTNASI